MRAQLGQAGGVAGGVGAPLVQAQGDGLEVARKVLQLRVRRGGQKAFGHQSCQLLGGVGGCVGGVFAVFDLALGGGKLHQYAAGQARHFAGDQRQAGAAFVHAFFEVGFARGQRLDQKGAVERDFDDLAAQFFERAAA